MQPCRLALTQSFGHERGAGAQNPGAVQEDAGGGGADIGRCAQVRFRRVCALVMDSVSRLSRLCGKEMGFGSFLVGNGDRGMRFRWAGLGLHCDGNLCQVLFLSLTSHEMKKNLSSSERISKLLFFFSSS